jgi:hypothetical protein
MQLPSSQLQLPSLGYFVRTLQFVDLRPQLAAPVHINNGSTRM